jgi:endonuclease/exonuclease/phosphatase family metal-dependent hydrolase
MRVRIVTLNVWNTEGDPKRPDIINRALKKLAPDLIACQEVVQTTEIKTLDRLLAGLDFHATHQSSLQAFVPPFADRYGGSALATRWEHRAVEALDGRIAGAGDVPWASLAAVVTIPDQGEMLFIAATSAWRPSAEAVRERQAIAIADLDARHRRKLPTIVAGDFNAAPDAAWAIAGTGDGHTWSVDNRNAKAGIDEIIGQPRYRERFDYVFVGSWDAHPEGRAQIQSAALAFNEPIDGIWASDHFGVVVDIDVSAAARG